ncbi:SDR family oxidoreductase [Shewanella inventionis]|uniref:3-oxoacyl-ACP reductase n=1 Tax=Shewanella inventionis TaxID=1738770 RepID=A0ABQ1JCS7_9GAMM|nr:SDR family oxidoreductase [Shewanella inventionis]MCL1158099.1 SDR family oxidoreductase [Shewanella inventionis]UAL43656.1 SDR family oxidoreductase [Shewanella inventionis]GGB65276.1 3-oxoacyl-ACP reductase [Shewanella inventionis]
MSQSTQYQDLTNKVIFITGGASGIGAAMVEAFARQHAKVAFIDIDQQAADALKQNLSQYDLNAIWFRAVDATDSESLQLAIRDVAEHFGRFDVLINNVANDARQDVETISAHDWHKCMQINLDPAFFASQAAYSHMKLQHSGSIINFSSITALLGSQQMTGYVTAKAGLIGMTRSLSREFGEAGIRVNAILPGWVATEKQLASWLTEQEEQKWTDAMALKRRITPEDVAKLALFLASDNSELITGQCINIDGGRA